MGTTHYNDRIDLDQLRGRTPLQLDLDGRRAAVLIPLIEREDGIELLLTKRSEELNHHPGQMSFPGGGREPQDSDMLETALREGNEEIGLPPERVRPIGVLDDIQTVSDYVVTPFVAWIPDRTYGPTDDEVDAVVRASIGSFLDPGIHEVEERPRSAARPRYVHYFHLDECTVWGATGRLIVQLLELTTDWRADSPVR